MLFGPGVCMGGGGGEGVVGGRSGQEGLVMEGKEAGQGSPQFCRLVHLLPGTVNNRY